MCPVLVCTCVFVCVYARACVRFGVRARVRVHICSCVYLRAPVNVCVIVCLMSERSVYMPVRACVGVGVGVCATSTSTPPPHLNSLRFTGRGRTPHDLAGV